MPPKNTAPSIVRTHIYVHVATLLNRLYQKIHQTHFQLDGTKSYNDDVENAKSESSKHESHVVSIFHIVLQRILFYCQSHPTEIEQNTHHRKRSLPKSHPYLCSSVGFR